MTLGEKGFTCAVSVLTFRSDFQITLSYWFRGLETVKNLAFGLKFLSVSAGSGLEVVSLCVVFMCCFTKVDKEFIASPWSWEFLKKWPFVRQAKTIYVFAIASSCLFCPESYKSWVTSFVFDNKSNAGFSSWITCVFHEWDLFDLSLEAAITELLLLKNLSFHYHYYFLE